MVTGFKISSNFPWLENLKKNLLQSFDEFQFLLGPMLVILFLKVYLNNS
jgi:hypothetical protein